jgi:nucleotide-binding universal stress UspA family protein
MSRRSALSATRPAPNALNEIVDASPALVRTNRRVHDAGILVATDGMGDADGAVRVGRALSQRDDVQVSLLSVVEPPPVQEMGTLLATDVAPLTRIMCGIREKRLRAQRDRTFPAWSDWSASIEVGDRVARVATASDGSTAGLIVIGLGAHGLSARLLGRETALRVIRESQVPVLAVPADAWGVPHSAMVAVDFTPSSEHAARAALDLLGGEGTLYLVHVLPRVLIPQGDFHTWDEMTTDETRASMQAIARRLEIPAGVSVKHVILRGEPVSELLQFADEFGVQLVAAGTHGRGALGRMVMGSVSTQLVRSAHSWVLVAPPGNDEAENRID